jgi:hypothetical protein
VAFALIGLRLLDLVGRLADASRVLPALAIAATLVW